MDYITFSDLEKNNFKYAGYSNVPLKDVCIICGNNFEYSKLKKFLKNRISLPVNTWRQCHKCFLAFRTSNNPEWIEKNRKAQLLAQNKPAQKLKNAIGVSKSWTQDRRTKASVDLKKRWKNNIEFANKARNSLKKYCGKSENIKKGFGCGGLKGIYKNISYDSALELSYILWCLENSIDIKRYDGDPISYIYESKNRLYFPDFIINNSKIIEVKGKGLYLNKNYKKNKVKHRAAKEKFGKNYAVIFDNNKAIRHNYKKARKLHHEIKK